MSRRRRPRRPMSSPPIRPVLVVARTEAELARHGYVGLEHLLLALTRPEAPTTARLLAEHGVTTQRAREAVSLVVVAGLGDGPRFDPATLLATLGLDLEQIRRQVEQQFGPGAIHGLPDNPTLRNLGPRGPLCDLGLSPQLKCTCDNALARCWDTASSLMHEHLLLSALDSDSRALPAVLHQLGASIPALRAATTQRRVAS